MTGTSTADDDHNVLRALGRLEASVSGLKEQWERQDNAATEGRRELYRRFDALRDQVIETKNRVDRAMEKITLMEPAVQLFRDGQQQLTGASRAAKVLWAALVACAGIVGWAIHELWHGAPH